jgi:hypothetical protein
MSTTVVLRRRESGSSYLIVLLALVVLTILGLALSLITQTEMQLGANERATSRSFYAADSGLYAIVPEVLVSKRYTPFTIVMNEKTFGSHHVADRVAVTQMVPILEVRCDWCPANEAGVPKFFKTNFLVESTSSRVTWDGDGLPPANAVATDQKTLSTMFEIQPLDKIARNAYPTANSLLQVKIP